MNLSDRLARWQMLRQAVVRSWRLLRNKYRQRNTLGARGENAAVRFLRAQGYHIIERQARSKYGEIDVVAVDQQTIVFVEVKTRRSGEKGIPAEAVTETKQAKLSRLASAYLQHHRLHEVKSRFDVVGVLWPADAKKPLIQHYRGAFTAAD